MRILGLGLVLLSGCGLLLDLDPPDMDAGPFADSGGRDAMRVDGGAPDGILVQPDGGMDGAIFDAGPPFDGGPCMMDDDCRLEFPECGDICVAGTCEQTDIDEDGICDPLDVCIDGDIQYLAPGDACATRALELCVVETWVEQKFEEVETCGPSDADCDGPTDESLAAIGCGIGQCAGRQTCNNSCVDHSVVAFDGCSEASAFGIDEDCDGRVDEDCTGPDSCTPIFPGDRISLEDGAYCLDVGRCAIPSVRFDFETGDSVANVRIYGDMVWDEVTESYVPCEGPTVLGRPRSEVVLDGTLQLRGNVQVSNVRFRTAAGFDAAAINVGGGTFRADRIDVNGGAGPALSVAEDATARLSDVRIISANTRGPTIDSVGELVIEGSCDGRANNRSRCANDDGTLSLGGISKATPGNSVISLRGGSASLSMTAVRVLGLNSTAIFAENVAFVNVYDSFVSSIWSTSVAARTQETIAVEGCVNESTIRDSFVINATASSDDANYGVRAEGCEMRFSAPNLTIPDSGHHIVGSLGRARNAVGVSCGAGCSFEQIAIAGFGALASPVDGGEGIAVECLTRCSVADSTLRANASVWPVGAATGIRIVGGTVLRSRVFGGFAAEATGIVALTPDRRARVHLQDSLVIGYGSRDTGAIMSFEGRGVVLQDTSSFSALHSTIAARTMTRLPVSALCRGIEAGNGTQVRLVSSVLWAPCVDLAHGYYGVDGSNILYMDHVGVDEEAYSFFGFDVAHMDEPFDFILVSEPGFNDAYAGGGLDEGPPEMVTLRDVNGRSRLMNHSIGAYAD